MADQQPEQPKERTLTAYQCFFRETFAELKIKVNADKGGAKWESTDTQKVVKQVGEQWRALTADEKAKYAGKATTTVKPKKGSTKKRKAPAPKEPTEAKPAADDGEPVERTLSAYQCFFKERFAVLKAEAETKMDGRKWASTDTQVVVKQLGTEWRAMDGATKKNYEGKMTTTVKTKRAKKKKAAADGKKPRKMTAYNIFVREQSKGKGAGAAERMKLIGEEWKKMGEEAKAEYKAKADALNAEEAKAL